MSIVAAAVVPHSPLLLPSIAKQHAALFAQTTESLTRLAADWYAAKPDAVMILSPHGWLKNNDMAIHSAEQFVGGFSDYGDMATTVKAIGGVAIMHQLATAAQREHWPIHIQTFDQLDYGTSVPLSFLLSAQPQIPTCPILIGTRQPEALLRLAAVIREFASSDRRRYLMLASCDMTRPDKHTPDARRRPTAEERAFSSAIVAVDPAQLTAIKPQATTCGYGPLLVLLGVLNGLVDDGIVETFEAPLGVGLLTASFSFNA